MAWLSFAGTGKMQKMGAPFISPRPSRGETVNLCLRHFLMQWKKRGFFIEMEKLEEYYNLQRFEGMPAFSALSSEEKSRFKNSVGFAFWNASKAISDLASAVKCSASRIRRESGLPKNKLSDS
jgi:hypothetical protein